MPQPAKTRAPIAVPQISRRGDSCTALAQGALQLFGMIEVSHEGGSHFDQQRFEFGILGAGNHVVSTASSTARW
jgi:hypothetical protein